jgi:hypothetical protein
MYEKKQGKDSIWYPYIKELDRHRGRGQLAVESPLLWTEGELDYLTGSPLKVCDFTLLYLNMHDYLFAVERIHQYSVRKTNTLT